MTDRAHVIAEVERYWLETGLPPETVDEMCTELEQHLVEAELDGRTIADVIGIVQRSPRDGLPPAGARPWRVGKMFRVERRREGSSPGGK